jgi:RNA polymerase sigma-70 factor (ECF subfamily)
MTEVMPAETRLKPVPAHSHDARCLLGNNGRTTMSTPCTHHLIAEARRGDTRSLEEILERSLPFLNERATRTIERKLKARLDPADLVQQTLLEAFRDFDSFEGDDIHTFTYWIQRILDHNIVEAHRRNVVVRKRNIHVERSIDDSVLARPKLRESLEAHKPTPSGMFTSKERAKHVRIAVASLPANQREVIWLKHFQQWPLRRIAHYLNRSESAIAGLLKRGIRNLRRSLKSEATTN